MASRCTLYAAFDNICSHAKFLEEPVQLALLYFFGLLHFILCFISTDSFLENKHFHNYTYI